MASDDAWHNNPRRYYWERPDAYRFIRHDAWRFMPPGSPIYTGRDVVKYCEPNFGQPTEEERRQERAWNEARLRELLELKAEFEELKADLARQRLEEKREAERSWQRFVQRAKAGFNPSQPRDELGRWSDGGGRPDGRVWLAANDKPRLGPGTLAVIATQVAKRAIEAFRKDNLLLDLFGERPGTVSYTTLDGVEIFGSNSTSPTYTSRDRAAALQLRAKLIEKYPDVMDSDEAGRRPNDALFHAETTALLRAARANGGTLAGRTLEVHSDRALCPSCSEVLPLVGVELGDPR
jgi:hypothetical protein